MKQSNILLMTILMVIGVSNNIYTGNNITVMVENKTNQDITLQNRITGQGHNPLNDQSGFRDLNITIPPHHSQSITFSFMTSGGKLIEYRFTNIPAHKKYNIYRNHFTKNDVTGDITFE